MKKLCTIILLTTILSGCAKWNSTGISYISPTNKAGDTLLEYKDGTKPNAQRVILWDSKYSAGISTKDGTCAQGALTVKSGSLDLSADNIGKLNKAKITKNTNALLINSTNGQTSFANISLFYLCQISLNRPNMNDEQIVQMWKSSNETLQKISPIAATNQTTADREKDQSVENDTDNSASDDADDSNTSNSKK